jgi:hypothetical protein
VGATLSSSSGSATYVLLPGQYTSNVQPDSLEQTLASATSTIIFTTGFSNSTTSTTPSLPLTIALQPGVLNYPDDGFSGDPSFYALPQSLNSTNNATDLKRGSILLAANTVAAIEATNNGQKSRVVLWDNVPFVSQLPYSMAGTLQVVSIQSTSCNPTCSSSGICTTNGSCLCPPNFTGQSCEQCADGHFGSDCKSTSEIGPNTVCNLFSNIAMNSLPFWMLQMRPRHNRNRRVSQHSYTLQCSIQLQLCQWCLRLGRYLHMLDWMDLRLGSKQHSMQRLRRWFLLEQRRKL